MTARLVATVALVLACAVAGSAQTTRRDPATAGQRGWSAIEERRFGDALEAFTEAAGANPRDPLFAAGAGMAAFMLGQNDTAVEWLERALKIAPSFTDASLLLGEVHYRDGRLQDAIAVYEAALKHNPQEPAFEQKLGQWRREGELRRGMYESRGAHFNVLFQGPADELLARRVVEILETAYWRVGSAFTAYPSQPITTILYTQEQFRDVTRSPGWAAAAYDGRIHVPMRGALEQPEELERILTHEFVHAVVAMLGGRSVPVWLNEGLASAFEPHADDAEAQLARSAARPSLVQLERSFGRLSAADARVAYAMSQRAVDRMIQLRGAPAVVALLQDLAREMPFATAFNLRIAMRYEDFRALVERD